MSNSIPNIRNMIKVGSDRRYCWHKRSATDKVDARSSLYIGSLPVKKTSFAAEKRCIRSFNVRQWRAAEIRSHTADRTCTTKIPQKNLFVECLPSKRNFQ